MKCFISFYKPISIFYSEPGESNPHRIMYLPFLFLKEQYQINIILSYHFLTYDISEHKLGRSVNNFTFSFFWKLETKNKQVFLCLFFPTSNFQDNFPSFMFPRNLKTLSGLRNSPEKFLFHSFTFPFYLVSHYRSLNSSLVNYIFMY